MQTPDGSVPASTTRRLVVKVTSGVDEPERLSQAFTVASTAVVSGVQVELWLTGEATWMAVPGRAEEFSLPHAAPLADLRDAILAEGSLTVCTQCAARRDLTVEDLVDGAQIKGAAVFVEQITAPGVQAIVY